MKIPESGNLLRIFIAESDRWHHQPIYEAIMKIKTGSSSQGMTARTRGIFRISTTVGLRGFFSSGLYQTGTEIYWAVKERLLQPATFALNRCVIRKQTTIAAVVCQAKIKKY